MSKCLLCNSKHKDPRCGDFIQKGKVIVHEYCLYLSSALLTNGDEDNGLYGFLAEDIYVESERVSHLDCVYCFKPYANIGCCQKKCRHTFHTLCGIENGCENQFVGTFRSYCKNHVHKHLRKQAPENEMCCICYDKLREDGTKYLYVNYIESPCCKNGWFHKNCLQGFARSAGYFFKCPLCNDTNKFKEKMSYRGIFVPERDAAWELEQNAFSELLERPSKCEMEICKHKRGRNACEDPRDPLLFCEACGAVAAHQNCLPPNKSDFICKDCITIAERVPNNEDSGRESLPPHSNEQEDEEIDVCTISESESDDDFLEKAFIKRAKRRVISDSSDMQPQASNARQKISQGQNSAEKRSYYENSEESNGSDVVCLFGRGKNRPLKLYNIEDTDDSNECTLKIKLHKNSCRIIDSTDESSDCAMTKRKTNAVTVIDSTDEESDSDRSSSSECLKAKRRRTIVDDESSERNHNATRTRINQSRRKPMPMNSNKKIDSYEDFSANLNTNDAKHKDENKANVSCVANRTRRRKSVYYGDPEYEGNNKLSCFISESKNRAPEKPRTSSCSSVEYFSSATSSTSTTSSSSNNRRHTLPQSQKSSSSSSLTSSGSSSLDISCIANRTRRRKSNRYSENLGRIAEYNEN